MFADVWEFLAGRLAAAGWEVRDVMGPHQVLPGQVIVGAPELAELRHPLSSLPATISVRTGVTVLGTAPAAVRGEADRVLVALLDSAVRVVSITAVTWAQGDTTNPLIGYTLTTELHARVDRTTRQEITP